MRALLALVCLMLVSAIALTLFLLLAAEGLQRAGCCA